ncbi:MAG: hypothetical protein LBC65_01330 [Oscillospiraceae bacterium]|nr:hypothetical protein [Oscillospiraceae bacterium]
MSASFVLVQRLVAGIRIEFPVGSGSFDKDLFLAVNTAVMAIDQFAMMPAQTFNMTSSTFAGQNIGAGKLDRVSQGFRIILTTAVSLAVVVMVVIFFKGETLMRLFITHDPSITDPVLLQIAIDRADRIVEVGVHMQRIIIWCYLMMAVANTVGGVMRGAGDTMAQLWIMISTNIVIRLPLTWIWIELTKTEAVTGGQPGGDPAVLFYSMIVAFGLNVIVSCIYFATGRWKTKSLISRKSESMLD